MAIRYKDAGVDIDAGEELVRRIAPLAKATSRAEVMSSIGGFAGACRIPAGMKEPILVSGTDGVGTKLKVAFATGRHDSIGIDLVAMCVNDVLCTGADPLFFLDYFATGKLDVDVGEKVIAGIASGCKQAGCALLGGETAELPGMYADGEYDLAGFAVGVVERSELRDGTQCRAGDVLIGLPSAGLHSNGYSLARKSIEMQALSWDARPDLLGGASIADEFLKPTRIYASAVRALRTAGIQFHGASHITGGGLIENPPRMFDEAPLAVELYKDHWAVPPIFTLVQRAGVEDAEMLRTFNMGLGFLLAIAPDQVDQALLVLRNADEPAHIVGRLAERNSGDDVRFVDAPR